VEGVQLLKQRARALQGRLATDARAAEEHAHTQARPQDAGPRVPVLLRHQPLLLLRYFSLPRNAENQSFSLKYHGKAE
jgi:hypothetical protein